MRPHCYMYGKKLDEREADKPLPPHSKKMREPPPNHEFSYRWFRGPLNEPCAYEGCTRRTSFSPHDWSKHALGGSGCSLQCVSTQSSLFRCTFCNSNCFVQAWKTQYTVPKDMRAARGTPMRKRSNSMDSMEDDLRSVGSVGSSDPINGSKSPGPEANPSTPRGFVGSYSNTNHYGGAPGSAGLYNNGQSEESGLRSAESNSIFLARTISEGSSNWRRRRILWKLESC
jgi:CCR4-NOT transcription complex subunit 6